MNREFFHYAFQISKMIVFEVSYYKLGNNQNPYFTTMSAKFIRNKRDYECCGQCQNEILPLGSLAKQFYKKWDKFHLLDLTDEQYIDLLNDIKALEKRYNFVRSDKSISFYSVVELSKMTPKPKCVNVSK